MVATRLTTTLTTTPEAVPLPTTVVLETVEATRTGCGRRLGRLEKVQALKPILAAAPV